ncbi:MAG: VOC family protein [Burkholderiaceae bacterium]|jgi:hypothetical protein|nr:VOC family protein [Burkholderiaceae bacterium]
MRAAAGGGAATPVAQVAQVDHIVIAAATLAEGVAWCEATLGATPGPGGRHALFGTHNRLLKIESEVHPLAYLEVIAADPQAPAPARRRWFGLDEPTTQQRLAAHGPQLLHVVVRTTAIDAQLAALAAAGVDAGVALAASRATPQGELRWRIAVRPDGRLLFGGALPTLIEWPAEAFAAVAAAGTARHPATAMPASPVRLREVSLIGLPDAVAAALRLGAVTFMAQSPKAPAPAEGGLGVTLDTPRGPVTLHAPPPQETR